MASSGAGIRPAIEAKVKAPRLRSIGSGGQHRTAWRAILFDHVCCESAFTDAEMKRSHTMDWVPKNSLVYSTNYHFVSYIIHTYIQKFMRIECKLRRQRACTLVCLFQKGSAINFGNLKCYKTLHYKNRFLLSVGLGMRLQQPRHRPSHSS